VPVYKSSALVLRCQDWSETSQVVHLLTREAGLLRCLAKGSRRDKNPFGGPFDRWTLGEAVFSVADPNRLATLMEFYPTERFEGLRRGLPAFYGAAAVTELVMALVPDFEPQPAVFDLAIEALRRLAGAEAPACQAMALAVAWRLLGLLGYMPPLDRCIQCDRPQEGGAVDFSPGLGGPVCPACRTATVTLHLSAKAAQAIAFLASQDWEAVRRVRLTKATAAQVRAVLEARIEELAGKKLSALRHV
jgi:DNA repair protein RecO (recombination protein O)